MCSKRDLLSPRSPQHGTVLKGLAQRLEEMDGRNDGLNTGPERRTRGVQEPKPGPKTTALIDSILIRECRGLQARVRTLEQAVAVHEDEIEYGTQAGKGTIAVQ